MFRKLVNLISAMESKNLVAFGVLAFLHMSVGGKCLYQHSEVEWNFPFLKVC